MKPERWGSPLVQEKYQEEKACDKRHPYRIPLLPPPPTPHTTINRTTTQCKVSLNSPPMFPPLSQINPAHVLTSCFFKISFNIILCSIPQVFHVAISLRLFWSQFCIHIFYFQFVLHAHLLILYTPCSYSLSSLLYTPVKSFYFDSSIINHPFLKYPIIFAFH